MKTVNINLAEDSIKALLAHGSPYLHAHEMKQLRQVWGDMQDRKFKEDYSIDPEVMWAQKVLR